MVFKVFEDPGLPRLAIPSSPPAVGDPLTAIGNGLNRGSATTFMELGGYNWGSGSSMRWGTNIVSDVDILVDTTYSFAATFTDPLDPSATADEAAGAIGDSGGGAFIKIDGDWYLAGIIFAISQYIGQPSTTSIYDNELFAVDLSFYRDGHPGSDRAEELLGWSRRRRRRLDRLPRRSGMREHQRRLGIDPRRTRPRFTWNDVAGRNDAARVWRALTASGQSELIREIARMEGLSASESDRRSAPLEPARLRIDAGRSVTIALGVERNRMRDLGAIGGALQ